MLGPGRPGVWVGPGPRPRPAARSRVTTYSIFFDTYSSMQRFTPEGTSLRVAEQATSLSLTPGVRGIGNDGSSRER